MNPDAPHPLRLSLRPRTGVFGATGAVGRELLGLLAPRAFPASVTRAFASERSLGTRLGTGSTAIRVEAVTEDVFEDLDLAFFCAGREAACTWAPAALKAGCIVIDNSSAFRGDPQVPLVVPEVNAADLVEQRGLIANPNCSTIIAMIAVAPLHRAFGLRRLLAATYQAASGAGAAGLAELQQGARAHLAGDPVPGEVFPEGLAFNVIPRIGSPGADGFTDEELKLRDEGRRILGAAEIEVCATCVRVPVERSHSLALTLEFEREAPVEGARRALERAPGLRLIDVPTPLLASGGPEVLAGRLRPLAKDPRALSLFVAGDQLLKGAALNALQIAETLLQGAARSR